jgi:putative ABC transport system permease protein
MQTIVQDIRYAARQLYKSPGFTITALITLALGIGVTAAVYSVIQTVLLEPLPYADPARLVGVAFTFPHEKPNAEQTGSTADFIREHMGAFSSVAVMDDSAPSVNLSVNSSSDGGSHAQPVTAMRVSEGYFRTLGVAPARGRGFLSEEDRPGGPRVTVLSDGLWARIFNRDPGVVGRTIRINQESYAVVGVMPASFTVTAETAPGVIGTPDLWQPLQLSPSDPGYEGTNYEMIARLRPDVALTQAQQQLSALQQVFYQQHPAYLKWTDDDRSLNEFRVWKLQDVVVGDVRRSLLTVMGAVIAVLLVACLNLAGLMMARAMRRGPEMAVRAALGATRAQLLRLLACEGLLLAMGGGVMALLVTRGAIGLLLHASTLAIPTLRGEPGMALLAVIVFAIALASTGVFSLLPAWAILRRQGRELRPRGPSLGENVSHARLSRGLIVAQVALAMLLVSTASVLLGTFLKLHALPSGIEPKQLTVFQATLKGSRYASTRETARFVTTVLERLRHAPGVKNAAAVNGLPLDRGLNMGGYPSDRPELRRAIEFRAITPGYFQTMGISLLAGRDLADGDRADGAQVVVIGETAARKWWPGRSPLGETIRIGKDRNWRIVGVVADVQIHSLVESQGIVAYGPLVQLSDEFTGMINNWFPVSFAVRAAGHMNLAAVAQKAVEEADPEIPLTRFMPMQAVIDDTIQTPHFFSMLAMGFSGFALALTVIGLFGLLSYQVTQRTREIGVRMALGADRASILRVFLGRGVVLASLGVVLGWAGTWVMRPVVAHLLADSGVDASPGAAGIVMNATMAAGLAAVAIVAASMAASWLPARRAASVEPMQALRSE